MSQVKDPKPSHWRSLAELENDPEFREMVQREWRVPLDQEPSSPARRRFVQVMGASLALAGVTGCRWKEDKMVDFAKRPQGMIPGAPRRYATTMEIAGTAVGLIATSYDGRPVKLEGNPAHPASQGAATVWHQASLLELYDPDRAQTVSKSDGGLRQKAEWTELATAVGEALTKAKAAGGKGVAVLCEASSSPSLADMKKRLLVKLPQAKWVEWEPVAGDEERQGTQLAFGKPHRVHLDLTKADVILSLDADLVGPAFPNGLAHARALADGRAPDGGRMNRLWVVESAYSHTGTLADHRLAIRSELVKAFAAALDAAVSVAAAASPDLGPAQAKPAAAFLADGKAAKFLEVLAKDLAAAKGRSVVIAGAHQPPAVHALAVRLNTALGNVGTTVWYTEEADAERPSRLDALKALTAEMSGGQVSLLFVLGTNPVYTAPADLDFAAALSKVETSIALTTFVDETAKVCTWHAPQAHWLETWGDAVSHDGTLSLAQPLIAPLFGGKSALELLALATEDTPWPAKDVVKRTHTASFGDERKWKKLVHDGFAASEPGERKAPKLLSLAAVSFEPRELGALTVDNGQLEIVFAADAKVYDGRFANNAWLQELPEPFTKLTWGNAALMSPETAAALGVTDGTPVTLAFGGKTIELPAMLSPGHARGSVKVALGYGRPCAGMVGGSAGAEEPIAPVGANAYALRTSQAFRFGGGLQVTANGSPLKLSTTQDVHAIDAVGAEGRDSRLHVLVREGTLEEFKKKPDFAKHAVHHPPLINLWEDPVRYDGYKWGMSIDLAKCTGCNACITACQAENNIAVVGKEQVSMGRELLWLRVDRYYRGKPEEAELSWQPLPCMQCDSAPCEQVCPVGATMHTTEGLNDMVYNRCIGTRYCANNCPYKVRRFNYLNNHLDKVGMTPWHGMETDRHRVKAMVFNPEVTVRSRGVMEKCTFCVQRIQNAKIKTKNAKRKIKDGDVQTACQQTCPTGAIVFGDLNDKDGRVAKLHALARSYKLLEELNNRPRVVYLARIKNPHPELV